MSRDRRCSLPTVGTVIAGVPNGLYPVEGEVVERDGAVRLISFEVTCGEGGAEIETVDFSIDGGVVAVADPRVKMPTSFWQRRGVRRTMDKRISQGLKGVPPGLYRESFFDSDGTSWAVVFYVGDGIYDVRVRRHDGQVRQLRCLLSAK